jgi:hypothetical protein
MPNPLDNATLEAGQKVYGRAAITDKHSEILSVDSSGIVQLGAGVSGVNAAVLQLAGTTLTATAAELNAADASAFARAATAAADPGLAVTATGVLNFIAVTSASADNIIILPDADIGTIFVLYVGSNGFELRSSAPATIAINGGVAAAAESAIAANQMAVIIRTSATTWHGFEITGATLTAIEAAA